jgi:hypothetical protein
MGAVYETQKEKDSFIGVELALLSGTGREILTVFWLQ